MKIHIDNVDLNSSSGPNSAGKQLAIGLWNAGHDVVFEHGHEADVSLVFIEPTGRPLAKKIVQRLDGIWSKPSEFEHKNKSIKRLYDFATAVVWQSEFDKKFITSNWGDKFGKVIHNGTSIGKVQLKTNIVGLRDHYEKVFVCSANWHRQKRLKENIELFFHLRNSLNINSCLLILGNSPDFRASSPHVFYAGSQSEEFCYEAYQISDWMLHLAYADHCPNTVVHALSQGCPVICTDIGGTQEIIGNFGVILKEEQIFSNEPFDYSQPPELNISQISSLPNKNDLIQPDVSIVQVVEKYLQLFKEIV